MEDSIVILEQYMYDSLKEMSQMRLGGVSREGIPLKWNEDKSRLKSTDGKVHFIAPPTNSQM